MKHLLLSTGLLLSWACTSWSQTETITADFEGSDPISTWYGDDCIINTEYSNPFQQAINPSGKVLRYQDMGGQYANVRFDVTENFNLAQNPIFTLMIYVPSSGIGGNQPNQVSLKVQNGHLTEPWSTQSEIIKPIALDQWQMVTFDFSTDNYLNLDGNSPPPTQRGDFNRVVIQVNGENNNDPVVAYLDDISYNRIQSEDPVFTKLVWADEFDGEGAIDATKWFQQTQLPAGDSWFNGEVQHYTDRLDNAYVSNGTLKIMAKKEVYQDQAVVKAYTSARLNSKFAFQYGRVEIRAKLPTGVGTWPAIWMLGQNISETGGYWSNQGLGTTPWPACGEIDIMEHWGDNQNFVQSATHTPSSHGNTFNKGGQIVSTASTAFHVYSLDWTAEKLVFSVDNKVHFTYQPPDKNADTWPFDAKQFLLLNVAIQPSIDPAFTEDAMEVDYVRVYQQEVVSTQEVPPLTAISAYPIPFTDQLTIELKEIRDQVIQVSLHTLDGKLVRTERVALTGQKLTLERLEALAPGMYVVKFEADGKQYSGKVVKR